MTDYQQALIAQAIALLSALLAPAVPPSIPEPVTISVATDGDVQAAIDAAPFGAIVRLTAGAVYSGHVVCHGGVTLTTDGVSYTEGTRATPADPLAVLASPDTSPAYTAAAGADGCGLVSVRVNGAVQFGTGAETDVAQLPRNGVVQHVVIHAAGLKRALSFQGIGMSLLDNYIDGPAIAGQDTQGVWINSGVGPYTIRNNYIEAGSENLLVGGDRVRIANLVPSDILIEDNTFVKPLAWMSQSLQVKNLLELKNAQRVTIRDNIFDGVWVAAQPGYAVLFTPRNQYGDNPWVVVKDVLFEHNTIRNASSAFNITGDDDLQPSQRTTNIVIRGNRMVVSKAQFGGAGRCAQIGRAPQQLTWDSNVCLSDGSSAIYTYKGGTVTQTLGSVWRNSAFLQNSYGFFSDNGQGTAALTAYYPGAIWDGMVVGGGSAKLYPIGTIIMTVADFLAKFQS